MKRGDNWTTKSRWILDLHLIDWEEGVISLETQLKIALRFKCQILVGWVEIWIWEMAPFGLPGCGWRNCKQKWMDERKIKLKIKGRSTIYSHLRKRMCRQRFHSQGVSQQDAHNDVLMSPTWSTAKPVTTMWETKTEKQVKKWTNYSSPKCTKKKINHKPPEFYFDVQDRPPFRCIKTESQAKKVKMLSLSPPY